MKKRDIIEARGKRGKEGNKLARPRLTANQHQARVIGGTISWGTKGGGGEGREGRRYGVGKKNMRSAFKEAKSVGELSFSEQVWD